jgi:hypothetical protein
VVVKNRFWSNDVDVLVAELKRDRRLAFTTVQAFKGVELHRFVPTGADRAVTN